MSSEEPKKVQYTEKEILEAIHAIALMYLLYERENETSLRIAFAALAEERHDKLHEGKFVDCTNDKCSAALNLLAEGREPKIELNDFSAEMIKPYKLNVNKVGRKTVVALVKKDEIQAPNKLTIEV
jgi:hypothetical protein